MKRIISLFAILPFLVSCASLKSLSISPTVAEKCYNALTTLGHSRINQYETCPHPDSHDLQGKPPHYDDNYNKRSEIGFGTGKNKKSALDAAVHDAMGSVPINYDNYRPDCDENLFGWGCTVIVEWNNPPEDLDTFIRNKRRPLKACITGDYGVCNMGNNMTINVIKR